MYRDWGQNEKFQPSFWDKTLGQNFGTKSRLDFERRKQPKSQINHESLLF